MAIVLNRNREAIWTPNDKYSEMETEEYRTRIELLCEITEEASSIKEVSKLLERILNITQHTVSASAVSLFLNPKEKGGLQTPITVGKYECEAASQISHICLEIAGWVANYVTPLLISDLSRDIRFGKNFENTPDSAITSIISVPIQRGKNVIGVLVGVKYNCGEFNEGSLQLLKSFTSTEALVLLVSMAVIAANNINSIALDHALLDGYRSIAEAWASDVDVKDSYAYAHSRRVKEYALIAANWMSLSPRELQAIEFGALLHDIGKMGVNSRILCKPGPLSDEEWKIMRGHSVRGADVLEEIPFLKDAKNIVLYHHERYDGKGYPDNLKGEEIPLGARLVAVADAFDTMTTDHSYRTSLSVTEAMNTLIDDIGTQFCPVAVEAFVTAFEKCENRLPFKVIQSESVVKTGEQTESKEEPTQTKNSNTTICTELFQGDIRLLVPITATTNDLRSFRQQLATISGIKIIMIGSSEEDGHFILVTLQEPRALMSIIGEFTMVETVEKKGKDILVILTSSKNQ